nr:MAG TPA: hypothetical protein [Caudoviricetes sp.]
MIPAYLTGAPYHLWIPGLIYLCLIVIIFLMGSGGKPALPVSL